MVNFDDVVPGFIRAHYQSKGSVRMLADYHVHHHLDVCASNEMTVENITAEAKRIGLQEIAILKHYSRQFPNGRAQYQEWHRIIPQEFELFLSEMAGASSTDELQIFSGVETELMNEAGDINIELEQQQRVDMVALSVHFMPFLDVLDLSADNYPHILNPNSEAYHASIGPWLHKVKEIGAENIIKAFINAYCNAIQKNPRVRTLAHMMDGLEPLRLYQIDVDSIEIDKLLSLMEPLMYCMRQHHVLWELHTMPIRQKAILHHANELGVHFCATADAHFISGGWANMFDHWRADRILDNLSLTRGHVRWPNYDEMALESEGIPVEDIPDL
jgi:histidinol phosphatase-like PHP family hydrolase